MAAIVVIVIIIAIVITIANILGKAKTYSGIQDTFAKAWASTFGTPVPEQALSAFTKMVSFVTEKEVDRSFGGTAADDYSPLSDSLDDFRRAVNYDNNKVAVPIAVLIQMLENTSGYPRAKKYVPDELMSYMQRRGI